MMDEGTAALAAFERALAAGPHGGAPHYTEATRHLCAMREALVASGRAGAAGAAELGVVNGLISCSLGGHFPIGKVPTDTIVAARDALRKMLAQAQTSVKNQATRS